MEIPWFSRDPQDPRFILGIYPPVFSEIPPRFHYHYFSSSPKSPKSSRLVEGQGRWPIRRRDRGGEERQQVRDSLWMDGCYRQWIDEMATSVWHWKLRRSELNCSIVRATRPRSHKRTAGHAPASPLRTSSFKNVDADLQPMTFSSLADLCSFRSCQIQYR